MDGEQLEHARAVLRTALATARRPLIAFSGGKDSLVAAHLATEFGVKEAICEESFYFSMNAEDARTNGRELGLRLKVVDSLKLEWLSRHPQYLFASDSKIRSKFFSLRQQATVARYAKEWGYDVVIFGRRTEENCCRADSYIARGKLQVFPIRKWKTADVWDYVAKAGLMKPRIYATEYGRVEGNGPFVLYHEADERGCWRVVADIDRPLVARAARYFPVAKEVLDG